MIFPALLLLAAPAGRVDLADEVHEIPAAEWKFYELKLRQVPVNLRCSFDVPTAENLRVVIAKSASRGKFDHDMLAATPFRPRGFVQYTVREPGDYDVIFDNRPGMTRRKVHLHISLDFTARGPQITYVPRSRQLAVILISFAVFFGIVIWSGRKLWRATRM